MHFFSLKYRNANNRHYLQLPMPPQTHTALSASWGEVRRGQWGRLLDSEVLLWRGVLWPFMQPFWRFIPPFRMSWMCWTIKLMATARHMNMVDTEWSIWLPETNIIFVLCMTAALTKIVCATWNYHICIFLCLLEIQLQLKPKIPLAFRFKSALIASFTVQKVIQYHALSSILWGIIYSNKSTKIVLCCFFTGLTGKQNSSKAGFTNVMYWASTCSSSLPRSLMSLRTVTQKEHNITDDIKPKSAGSWLQAFHIDHLTLLFSLAFCELNDIHIYHSQVGL